MAQDPEVEEFEFRRRREQEASQPEKPTLIEQNATNYKNLGMGALKGAADIGATILSPIDALIGKTDRRQHSFVPNARRIH